MSAQLMQALQQFSTPPAQAVEPKMASMKTEIMQEIGVKMEENK